MSGIFGIADPKRQIDMMSGMKKMSEVMSHRDWYVSEYFIEESHNLALGRIGIGILNKISQPVWNSSNTIALVMAGEIYNRETLDEDKSSKSDEQIALALYEQLGDQFVSSLDGAFVIAIWDKKRRCLFLVNDRFGLYPTYIAQVGHRFIFAPEVKGILVDQNVNRSLRYDSISEFFRLQRLLGTKTFFEGIAVLPPASLLTYTFDAAAYQLHSYWDMSTTSLLPESITFDEAVEEGARLLRASVVKRTRGNKRIGVFLSGGLDSRAILGMIPSSFEEIHTFTFGQPGCRDEYYARKIALAAGTQHHYSPYEKGNWIIQLAGLHMELTEGFHPWIHMHGIDTLPMARQYIDVNLSGLGDLLWNHPNFVPRHLVNAPDETAFISLFFELYTQKYTWPSITYSEERYLYHESFYPHVRDVAFDSFVNELKAFANLPFIQRVAAFNLVNHFSRHLLYAGVFGRSHIEYRFPYFDIDLMTFCYGVPYELGYDRRLQKAIIERTMPALARIPYGNDELPVTSSKGKQTFGYLINKLKRGVHQIVPIFPQRPTLYADYETWLRTDLRDWAEDILFDERTLSRGIFRPSTLRSLMDRHLSGHQEWLIGKIAPIITFEMMLRRYYD